MTILDEGRNCWCVPRADKGAFLIDGAAYFDALADAMEQAQHTIMIAAWDIDSRIRFSRQKDAENTRNTLGDFLNTKAERTPGLHIFILAWDFPMLYLRERQWLPIFNLGWKTHRRIHFHMDDEHPIGASQHQKLVVIDDRVAFCGGFDLSNSRWDTPRHLREDSRRINPDGEPYGPFHDVQMVVQGDAAEKLSELFRDRWERATGGRIDADKTGKSGDRWPKGLVPDLKSVQVAVARTIAPYKDRRGVREIENLYRDGIGAAQKCIYIETQYLTAGSITEAISAKLTQQPGPDIVIVLPRKSSGWLEQSTMDALRARALKRLFELDRYQRLRAFYPALNNQNDFTYVHSKLMIVDDRLAVVGSANLSNRSMGLDSECCLAVEADNQTGPREAIASLRNRLLAEHTGSSTATVARVFEEQQSLNKTIESLPDSSSRRLENLDYELSVPIDSVSIIPDHKLLDPEAPVEFDRMMDNFVKDEDGRGKMWPAAKIVIVLMVLLALAAAWRWTPLAEWISSDRLAAWAREARGNPMYFPIVIGAFVVGGLLMVPITLLVGVTAMVFSPGLAAALALVGCLLNALASYLVGSILGKQPIRKLTGQRLNRLSRQMARKGVISVAIVRNIPIAPFTIVNLIAGASHIRLKDYLIGTAIGMLPGILAITYFSDRLLQAIMHPGWLNAVIAALLAAAIIFTGWWLKNRLGLHRR